MSKVCDWYGHEYTKNISITAKLPKGYVYERCGQCGDTRTVYYG